MAADEASRNTVMDSISSGLMVLEDRDR